MHERGLELMNEPGQYTFASTTTPDMVWATSNTVQATQVRPKDPFTDHCRVDLKLLQAVHYQKQEDVQAPKWVKGKKWAKAIMQIQHTLEYIAAVAVITSSSKTLRAASLTESKELQRRTVLATTLWWRAAAITMSAHADRLATLPKKREILSPQEASKRIQKAVDRVWQGIVDTYVDCIRFV